MQYNKQIAGIHPFYRARAPGEKAVEQEAKIIERIVIESRNMERAAVDSPT